MNTILVIAGSDSCAGAGAQIDLKTAAAHGVYATCALTAVTAQNTRSVDAVQLVQPDVVLAQIEAVFADMPPQAIKIGMLGSSQIAQAVAKALSRHPEVPIVLDPVLVATAGGALGDAAAFADVRDTLVCQARIIAPNIPEACALSGVEVVDAASMREAAKRLLATGVEAVLVKGGHATGETLVDRLYLGDEVHEFTAQRLCGEFHGTGCSLSTAIACNLATGHELVDAVVLAREYLFDALHHVVGLGSKTTIFNPLNRIEHFYAEH